MLGLAQEVIHRIGARPGEDAGDGPEGAEAGAALGFIKVRRPGPKLARWSHAVMA